MLTRPAGLPAAQSSLPATMPNVHTTSDTSALATLMLTGSPLNSRASAAVAGGVPPGLTRCSGPGPTVMPAAARPA